MLGLKASNTRCARTRAKRDAAAVNQMQKAKQSLTTVAIESDSYEQRVRIWDELLFKLTHEWFGIDIQIKRACHER